MLQPNSLTVKRGGIMRVLTNPVDIFIANTANHQNINAIWDTGATSSAITSNVVNTLGLTPTGFALVNTAGGTLQQNTYTVDIRLSNGVKIFGVTVTEVSALAGGCDALIGMDIITLGDFSITNHHGNTCMSFRVPSGHEIDYVANPNYGMTPVTSPKPSWLNSKKSSYKGKRK